MEKEVCEMGKEIFDYLKANFKVYTIEECKELKDKGAYGVIYMTKCKVNDRLYIGQKKIDTQDFDTYLGSGKILKQAVDKYGRDNFERIILEVAYSQEELDNFEIKYISIFDASEEDLFYNIACGGSGICLKGKNHPRYKEKITLKCDYCGKEIEKLESRVKGNKNTFCSNECQHKWLNEYLRGKNCSLYKGFVIIYPNGEVSKEMTGKEIADYLNVSIDLITELAREKTCYIGNYEHIRYIRVLHLEDYLEEREFEDFRNMCKRMVEEAEILYEIKKEELKNKFSEIREGIKNPNAKSLVCIFPDGRIIKDICVTELAKELNVSQDTIRSILNSHEPYKPTHKRLKRLEGIVIIYQKDYLNTLENTNTNINNDKAS